MSQPEEAAAPAPKNGAGSEPLGQRHTRTREAVVQVVREAGAAGRALSAAQILAAARKIEPSLGHATVYRTLHLLQEAGELRQFAPHHLAARYEIVGEVRGAGLVNQNGELLTSHDRFECRGCRRAFALDAEINLDPARLGLDGGFVIEEREITLHGLCPHCTSA